MPIRKVILFLMLIVCALPAMGEDYIPAPQSGSEGTVITQGAALRSEPTKAVPMLLNLNSGDALTVRELLQNNEGVWYSVVFIKGKKQYEGYVLSDYVSIQLYDENGDPILIPVKLRVRAEAKCPDGYNHVGFNWSKAFSIGGETLSGAKYISLCAGDEIRLDAAIYEEDSYMDSGHGTLFYAPTQAELDRGFSVSFDVYVSENRGRYSGYSCRWAVTFYFTKG